MDLDAEQRVASLHGDAIVAELTETVELQARKLATLSEEVDRVENDRRQLRTELHMARAWIRELAAELETVDVSPSSEGRTLRERIDGR